MFGAEVLRLLPAARGQVENGGGGHVSSFGIVGVVVDALPKGVQTQAGRGRLSCKVTS